MKNSVELEKVCRELGIGCRILFKEESVNIIKKVFDKYKVGKKSGHLAIQFDSISIPLNGNEFTYSSHLNNEPIYVFFDQENNNRNEVILIDSSQRLGEIMENSFGMEYFVTNKKFSYLIAINWYVIEGAGIAKDWMKGLVGNGE